MQITATIIGDHIESAASQDGRYTWFCGADGYLQDTQAGRAIYQMAYLRNGSFGSDPLPADVESDARAFWAALHAAQQALAADHRAAEMTALQAEIDGAQAEDPKARAERERRAREYDELQNEGGEGYNPYRS